MRSTLRKLGLIALATSLVLFYQNCGRLGFDSQKGIPADYAAFGACETALKDIYATTYHPILSDTNHCYRCHAQAHGSKDLDISFDAFMERGVVFIDSRASTPHADNGLDLSDEIAAIKPDWDTGEGAYTSCKQSAGTTQ